MRKVNLGKRPIEEHDNARLPENPKRRQGDDSASIGFGLGPAGRRHFLFADTARGAYDQAGPSQAGPSHQEDGRLNSHERALIEHSKRYIERSGSDAWHNLMDSIDSIGPSTREFFRDLIAKLPMEEQRVFGIQQPEGSRRQQIRQMQNDILVQNQAGQSDYLKSNAGEVMQIQRSYLEHKKMQGHFKNEDIAQSFLNCLSDKYRQEFETYSTTGRGSHDAEQIYSRWYKLYKGD